MSCAVILSAFPVENRQHHFPHHVDQAGRYVFVHELSLILTVTKQELQTWFNALSHYDKNDFQRSLEAFQPIADTSKILFNCAVIQATLGRHSAAVSSTYGV